MANRAELEAIIKLREEISGKIATVDKQLARLDSSLNKVQKNTSNLGSQFKQGALQAIGLGTAIGGAALAVGKLVGTISEGVKGFVSFEKSMLRIETLVGVSRQEVEAMKASVRGLATETGRAPQELADALFDITSAGLRGQDAMIALEASARGAALGLGETRTVASAATSIVNAYGVSNINAAQAVDVLISTVRLGKAEADAFASSIGTVIPIASSAGVSIQEVGTAMAILTRSGASASEAATQVAGLIREIVKPSEQAADALESVGLTMDDIRKSIRERGLLATIEELRQKLDPEQMARFAGRAEALNAVLGLTGDKFGQVQDAAAEMGQAFGLAEEGMKRLEKEASFRAERVSAAWQSTKDSLGESFVNIAFQAVKASDAFFGFEKRAQEATPTFVKLSDIVQSVFTRTDITTRSRDLARELGIINEHGLLTTDAMDKLRAELDRLGISSTKQEDILRDLAGTMLTNLEHTKALPPALGPARDATEALALLQEQLATKSEKATKETEKLTKAQREAAKAAQEQQERMRDLVEEMIEADRVTSAYTDQARELDAVFDDLFPTIQNNTQAFAGLNAEVTRTDMIGMFEPVKPVIEKNRDVTAEWADVMSELRGLFNIFGVDADSALGKVLNTATKVFDTFNAITGLFNKLLGLFGGGGGGGLGGLFGGGGGGGLLGRLFGGGAGGAGAAAGAGAGGGAGLGAALGGFLTNPFTLAIGGGLAAFFGLKGLFKGASVEEAVERDFNASLSKGLLKAIEGLEGQRGDIQTAIQLSLGDIFRETELFGGNFDLAVERAVDTLSFLERGQVSAAEAQRILNDTVAQLLPVMTQLGPAGEAQIERLIRGAERLGISFEGMEALAKQFGIELAGVFQGAAVQTEGFADSAASSLNDVASEGERAARRIQRAFDFDLDRFRGGEVVFAQHGFSGMVGPGFGGPKLFVAGEGSSPEHVRIGSGGQTGGGSAGLVLNISNITIGGGASHQDARDFVDVIADQVMKSARMRSAMKLASQNRSI